MGDLARAVSASKRIARRAAALVLALGAVASAGAARAQTIWDDPAFALYRRALEAMDKKDYARAGDLAAQAIEKHSGHVLAYYVRGQAAAAQSRWDEAATAFGKAAELYGESFAAHRDHGISLEQLRRLPAAAAAYERALALKDQDDLRARLAFVLIEDAKEARALEQLRRLADRNTGIPEVWSALGRLHYEAGEFAEAESAYMKAVSLKDDGRTWFNLAAIRMRRSNTPGALEAFKRAAQHAETKEQAESEMKRLRDAATRDRLAPIDRARGTLQYNGPGR
jgi:tetratricopeptide (TPR) repeat protein